jgi:large subunit ribosomal protein L23
MAGIDKSPYNIIVRPIVTEKSALASNGESSTVIFEVNPKANKIEIKKAVEKIFNVKVKSVHTLRTMGKIKRVYAKTGKQKTVKKAFVALQPGSTINVIEGL